MAALIIAGPASAMTRAQALERCSGEALAALPPPSGYWVRSEAELAGAEIGDALGRGFILLTVRAACMKPLGFGSRPVRRAHPVGTRSLER